MQDVIEILKRVGAIVNDGHFVGASGRHLRTYINKDKLFPHTEEASKIGQLMAEKNLHFNVEAVVAPAFGGIILSQWTAYHLSQMQGKKVFGVYTEKNQDEGQIFTRGYGDLVQSKRVLVLEDLTTTGGSVKKVVEAVRGAGGAVVAICAMVNRDPQGVNSEIFQAPFSSLGVLPLESYSEKECPMCALGVPIDTNLGHGKKYLSKTRDQNPAK